MLRAKMQEVQFWQWEYAPHHHKVRRRPRRRLFRLSAVCDFLYTYGSAEDGTELSSGVIRAIGQCCAPARGAKVPPMTLDEMRTRAPPGGSLRERTAAQSYP